MLMPAQYAFTLLAGSLTFVLIRRRWPKAAEHFGESIAAGAIAAESLVGSGAALLAAAGWLAGRGLAGRDNEREVQHGLGAAWPVVLILGCAGCGGDDDGDGACNLPGEIAGQTAQAIRSWGANCTLPALLALLVAR